jgi:hypothetical protein
LKSDDLSIFDKLSPVSDANSRVWRGWS